MEFAFKLFATGVGLRHIDLALELDLIFAALCWCQPQLKLIHLSDLIMDGGIDLHFGFERGGGELVLRIIHDKVGHLKVGF